MHWTLQRKDNNEQLILHDQFWWRDEYDWTPIAQSTPVYTLSGALDVQQGTRKAGRPITLDCRHAYMTRAQLETLQNWSAVAELEMRLIHPNTQQFNVIFTRPALSDVQEIKPYKASDMTQQDKLRVNINLMEI